MKRTKLRRKSKSEIRKLQDRLWELCRQITFKEYGNTCYTCGARNLEKYNLQCGHMWPKASLGASLKYSLDILRPQCARCNIFLGGMGAVFYQNMLKEIGAEKMAQLEQRKIEDKKGKLKATMHYEWLILQYQDMI